MKKTEELCLCRDQGQILYLFGCVTCLQLLPSEEVAFKINASLFCVLQHKQMTSKTYLGANDVSKINN